MSAINKQIPDEIIAYSASFLDKMQDRSAFGRTCRDFHKYIESAWLNESKATLKDFSIQNWPNLQIKQVAFAFNPIKEELMCALANNDHNFQNWPIKYLIKLPNVLRGNGFIYSKESIIGCRTIIINNYFPADRPLITKTNEKLVNIGVDKLGLSERASSDIVCSSFGGLLGG